MDKSEGKDWFAKTLNTFTEETAKVYKISRLKLEIGTANKTKNEKINLISRKLIALIQNGKIDAELFEPEYSAIIDIDKKILDMETEIEPLNVMELDSNISEAARKLQRIYEIEEKLPGKDCGSCGSPTCRSLAEDIVLGYANELDCVFLMREKVRYLAEEMVGLASKDGSERE